MKKEPSKSAKILALREKDPNIKAVDIIAQMKKDGTPVSSPLVYQVLKRKRTGKKRGPKPGARKAGKRRGPKPRGANVAVALSFNENLFASMQQFVSAAGSLDKAIEILSVFKT